MSVYIGQTPLFLPDEKILTINSTRSNVINLMCSDSNVLLNIGEYVFGQTSNLSVANDILKLELSSNNQKLATFTNTNTILYEDVILNKEVTILNDVWASSNISSRSMDTSNVIIHNNRQNDVYIDVYSNTTSLLQTTNRDNGTLFVGGYVGIGTAVDNNFSLITNKDIYSKQHIHTSNIFSTGSLYGNSLIYNSNAPILYSYPLVPKISGIYIDSNNIFIDATKVKINNFTLGGITEFESISVLGKADFKDQILSKYILLSNLENNSNCLQINQRLINDRVSLVNLGNPVMITTEYPSMDSLDSPVTILGLSPYGHLQMGDESIAIFNEQTDYMFRGTIKSATDEYFKGFLHFSTKYNNNSLTKTTFSVNKEGYLAIGNAASKSMMEIKNVFNGSEPNYNINKPSTMFTMCNTFISNQLPMAKYYTPTAERTMMHITSNASICFREDPVDVYKYQIESHCNAYFNSIELRNLKEFKNTVINANQSRINNIKELRLNDSYTDRAEIITLFVDNFTSRMPTSLSDTANVYKIGTNRLLFSGSNIVINKNFSYFDSAAFTTDSIRLYTNGDMTDIVNAYNTIGNNREIVHRTNNLLSTGKVSYELNVNNNRFKMGLYAIPSSQDPNKTASFYITPLTNTYPDGGISDQTGAINVFPDKLVKFGTKTYLNAGGIVAIGQTIETDAITGLYITGGFTMRSSLTGYRTFVVDSVTGNVGLGTTTTRQQLEVQGRAIVSGNIGIGIVSPRKELDVIGEAIVSGNIGIGVTVPRQEFEVKGKAIISGNIGVGIMMVVPRKELDVLGTAIVSDRIGIRTIEPYQPLDVEGIAIISTRVGIGGTRDPSHQLDVLGNSYLSGTLGIGTVVARLKLDVLGGATISENVGIGSTVPQVKLVVNSTDAILISRGSTAERPVTNSSATVQGYIRYNTQTDLFEGYGTNNNSLSTIGSESTRGWWSFGINTWMRQTPTAPNIYFDTGSVGIGTSTPTQAGLVVVKDAYLGKGLLLTGVGGPFFKQMGWSPNFANEHEIKYSDYAGGGEYNGNDTLDGSSTHDKNNFASGIINVQLINQSRRMATMSISFVKDTNSEVLLNMTSYHSSEDGTSFDETDIHIGVKSTNNRTIFIFARKSCKISWTSIGSSALINVP